MIEKYTSLIKESDGNPFDFLPDKNLKVFDNFKPQVKEMLIPFGSNKAGCLICFWKDQTDIKKCPIVWLDSEGQPNAVFVANIEDFFRVLPYGTGLIYDVIVASERYVQDQSVFKSPAELLQNSFIEEISKEDKQHTAKIIFIKKMNDVLNIETANDPGSIIFQAYKSFLEITKKINSSRI